MGFLGSISGRVAVLYTNHAITAEACSSAVQRRSRTVGAILTAIVFGIRTASIGGAEPAALAGAPVPPVHESKWPPSITMPAFGSVRGISAVMLKLSGPSMNLAPR